MRLGQFVGRQVGNLAQLAVGLQRLLQVGLRQPEVGPAEQFIHLRPRLDLFGAPFQPGDDPFERAAGVEVHPRQQVAQQCLIIGPDAVLLGLGEELFRQTPRLGGAGGVALFREPDVDGTQDQGRLAGAAGKVPGLLKARVARSRAWSRSPPG